MKAGDSEAAERLWERYFETLVRLASKKLQGAARAVADEEDVALSAMKSLCLGAREGRFPLLADRDSLWRLLVVLTARKASDQRLHELRQKRGGGKVVSATSGAKSSTPSEQPRDFEEIIGQEPTPEFAALMADQCRRLLECLGDEGLRSVALWKMEGFTNEEVAAKLGCVPRTVERKLQMIRDIWEKEGVG